MCYAKPGPRCTAHAKKALEAAIIERDAAMEALHSPEGKAASKAHMDACRVERERLIAAGTPWTRDEEREWLDAQPYRQQYGIRASASHPALEDAQDDYDATPGGITDMKARLAGLEDEHGDRVLTVPLYINTQVRLNRAQQRRATQLETYKATEVALDKAATHEPDAVEDEEEAAAPAPPCSCIEYRYQSDCAHLNARVEQARVHYLPTSREASLSLHAARSRRRGRINDYEAIRHRHGLDQATSTQILDAAKTSANLQQAMQAASQAAEEESAAATAFYATPAGMTLLRERDERRMPVMGAGPSFIGTWDTIVNNAARSRESKARQFEELTGQQGIAVDDATPPDIMYGQSFACPQGCPDFKWTAECVHTQDDWAKAAQLSDAIAQLPEVKAMRKGMDKAFEPKKPSLLSRLTGRR